MPSVMTHYLMGLRLSKYLHENYKEVKFSENAMMWGAQGPDFLFSYNSENEENPIKKLGKDMHAVGSDKVLNYLSDFARSSQNGIDTGYVLGFFSHYALDSLTHPFVLYGAKQMAQSLENTDEHLSHLQIESNLDVIMLHYEQGKVTNELNLKVCAPKDDMVCQHMTTIYTMMCKNCFAVDIDMDQVYKATEDYRKKLKQLNDYTGFKRDMALRKEKKEHTPPLHSVRYRGLTEDESFDYANIAKKTWNKNGKEHTENFMELFEQAYSQVTAMADIYLQGGSVCDITNNLPMI